MSNNFDNDDDEFSVSSSDSDNSSDNDDDNNNNKLKINNGDDDVNDDDLNNSDSDEEKEEEEKKEDDEDEEDKDYYDEAEGVDEYEEPEVGDEENPENIMPPAVSSKKAAKPNVGFSLNNFNNNDEDDDEDDDDDDENYLQKFDRDIKKNYINEFHPECIIHNFDEVVALSHVSRDKNGIIIDDLHRTNPFLTKYERARILGQRAKQIECGAKPFIKVPENIVDSYIIADLELKQKKIPFIIRRPIPGGGCEYWNIKDLEMILF